MMNQMKHEHDERVKEIVIEKEKIVEIWIKEKEEIIKQKESDV